MEVIDIENIKKQIKEEYIKSMIKDFPYERPYYRVLENRFDKMLAEMSDFQIYCYVIFDDKDFLFQKITQELINTQTHSFRLFNLIGYLCNHVLDIMENYSMHEKLTIESKLPGFLNAMYDYKKGIER